MVQITHTHTHTRTQTLICRFATIGRLPTLFLSCQKWGKRVQNDSLHLCSQSRLLFHSFNLPFIVFRSQSFSHNTSFTIFFQKSLFHSLSLTTFPLITVFTIVAPVIVVVVPIQVNGMTYLPIHWLRNSFPATCQIIIEICVVACKLQAINGTF